jgi:iron(III) transport system substrate-binding protein
MRSRSFVAVLILALLFAVSGQAAVNERLTIYTSMKETLIGGIVEGFKRKYPDITVVYHSAGAGALMTKISAERENGKRILADIIWTSEVSDFYNMKNEGLLEKYETPLIKEILNPFDDYDGHFTAVRLGILGIAVNTNRIQTPPEQWSDLFKPEYKGAFGIADPALSGTAYMSVALLEKQFGWEFFDKLRANQARIGKGSSQVVDDTVSGELAASIAVDYIANDKIAQGAPIALYYPPELLMTPSSVAIFKGGPNVGAAKKFVDYLLSREAQILIAAEGTLPVRTDVEKSGWFMLPEVSDALEHAIKIDYLQMMASKEATIKKFTDILRDGK